LSIPDVTEADAAIVLIDAVVDKALVNNGCPTSRLLRWNMLHQFSDAARKPNTLTNRRNLDDTP
jgi:hypothetical protein